MEVMSMSRDDVREAEIRAFLHYFENSYEIRFHVLNRSLKHQFVSLRKIFIHALHTCLDGGKFPNVSACFRKKLGKKRIRSYS